ncbi:MAG: sigma 54-interacting transcriptional regulator [Calditrichia bacterium]
MLAIYKFSFQENETPQIRSEHIEHVGKNLSAHFNTREWVHWTSGPTLYVFLVHQSGEEISAAKVCKAFEDELPCQPLASEFYSGEAAVEHFLEVASGIAHGLYGRAHLEALQESYQNATGRGTIGPIMHHLFQRGILLHEQVRQDTDFFRLAVNSEAALYELSAKVLALSEGSRVLSIGDIEPALPFFHFLRGRGIRHLQAVSDTEAPEQLPDFITFKMSKYVQPISADESVLLLFPSTALQISDAQLIELAKTRKKPLLVFDLTNTARNLRSLRRQAMLYFNTEDDLKAVISSNLNGRKQTTREISRWISLEREQFFQWLASDERFEFAGIVGSTPAMQQVFELISRIARTDITVLIDGESGTGKERVARAIHSLSGRSERPFQVLNCGAIPENLLESELFGHEKGAFTGAVVQKRGLFEEADGGTLLLDEIGELPAHLQVKLLRFLQEGEIKHVGSNETRKVDVRIVAATNQDLAAMVAKQTFRSDLYYRLNVLQLTVPPLRKRKEDVLLLAEHFRRRFSQKLHKSVNSISDEALRVLQHYSWPGNVRELENAIERAVALALGEQILAVNLPQIVQSPPVAGAAMSDIPFRGKQLTLKELEREYILATLEQFDWNYDEVCKKLAIGRTTLWRKLREYNVIPPSS